MYLTAFGARLALGPWETQETSGAPLSLRAPNASCSLNPLREKQSDDPGSQSL